MGKNKHINKYPFLKGKEEIMNKNCVINYYTTCQVNLVYDYERDDNFDWESLRKSDLVNYLYSKSEELLINRIDYKNHYSKKHLDELKFFEFLYLNSAVHCEKNTNFCKKLQERISK